MARVALAAKGGRKVHMAKIRILLADDHTLFRQGIKTLISAEPDMEVVGEASNGGDAVEKAAEVRPDVVLMDIGMPGMDGYELMRAIRALPDEHAQRVPAVAVTAYARSEDRQRALAEGFQLHLAKPIEPAAFASAVARLSRSAELAAIS